MVLECNAEEDGHVAVLAAPATPHCELCCLALLPPVYVPGALTPRPAGCLGGEITDAFDFVTKFGLTPEAVYPCVPPPQHHPRTALTSPWYYSSTALVLL